MSLEEGFWIKLFTKYREGKPVLMGDVMFDCQCATILACSTATLVDRSGSTPAGLFLQL